MHDDPRPYETYLTGDHARRFPSDAGTQAQVPDADIRPLREALDEHGFVVIRQLVPPDRAATIRAAIEPLLDHRGRNPFEGVRTQRLYSVVTRTAACDPVIEHPLLLGLLDGLLRPNYLLSQVQVIRILEGEDAQLLHHDDAFYPVPRPRPPLSVSVMMALDPFTADNGATVLIPGSHRWGDRLPSDADPRRPAEMAPGDALVFLGTTWHGGGASRRGGPRTGLTVQYCDPWLRTQENYAMSVPRARAQAASPHLQRLLGYSVHPPFLGAVNGMHPKRLLEVDEPADASAGSPLGATPHRT